MDDLFLQELFGQKLFLTERRSVNSFTQKETFQDRKANENQINETRNNHRVLSYYLLLTTSLITLLSAGFTLFDAWQRKSASSATDSELMNREPFSRICMDGEEMIVR